MADVLVTSLGDYLGEVAKRRFEYGSLDCCTFIADWLMECGVPDVMSDRRGSYSTRDQFRAAMRMEGGIVKSCRARLSAVGLRETAAVKCGDVCLVRAPLSVEQNGCVRWGAAGSIVVSGDLRAVVTRDRGVVCAAMGTIVAWGVV